VTRESESSLSFRISLESIVEILLSIIYIEENRRTKRFWVPMVWAAVPTFFVTFFSCFLLRHDGFPEFVVGILFLGVVIPAAMICEKLGLGQFSIFGGSTIPDWVFVSVMVVLVYLYCLVAMMAGRGVVRLALQARRTVRGER